MSDLQERIERFENMATADPTNDMAHFSLGSAYLDASRYVDAADSFQTCVDLNGDMTRAMELGGSALMQSGHADKAEAVLRRGYMQAASRGEMRVKESIEAILKEAGLPIPEVETGSIGKRSTGKPLEIAPLPGSIGDWIVKNISTDVWESWIGQGTKVINELRLDFSKVEDQRVYEEYMVEFLGIPADVVEQDKPQSETEGQSKHD